MSREPRPTVLATDHTSFTVADLDRSLAFWRDVMGFEVSGIVEPDPRFAADLTGLAGARARIAFVFAPGHKLELIEYRHPPGRDGPPPRPCDPGFAHVAFQVADIEAAAAAITAAGWQTMGGIETVPTGPRRGGRVVYLRAPDGVAVELMQAPPSP